MGGFQIIRVFINPQRWRAFSGRHGGTLRARARDQVPDTGTERKGKMSCFDEVRVREARRNGAKAWRQEIVTHHNNLARFFPSGGAVALYHPNLDEVVFAEEGERGTAITFYKVGEYNPSGRHTGGLRHPAPKTTLAGVLDTLRRQGAVLAEEVIDRRLGYPRLDVLDALEADGEFPEEE